MAKTKRGRPQEWTAEKIQEACELILKTVQDRTGIKSFSKALVLNGLYETCIHYWRERFPDRPDLFEPLTLAREIIKSRLIDHGLESKHGARMAQFVLSVNHGMKETKRHEHSGDLQGPPSVTINLSNTD